jgi:hypothetical protein
MTIDHTVEREYVARTLGNDKHRLERRLRLSAWCLAADLRPLFRRARFSFATKRLTSACGKYALQWQLRRNPDKPEDYHNQQTTGGFVALITL